MTNVMQEILEEADTLASEGDFVQLEVFCEGLTQRQLLMLMNHSTSVYVCAQASEFYEDGEM